MAAVIQDDREGAETDKRAGDREGLDRTAAEDCLGPQQPADRRKQEISSGNLKTKSMLSTLIEGHSIVIKTMTYFEVLNL